MRCEELMTEDPYFCVSADSVTAAARIMKAKGVGAVPVVESDGIRRALGVVTDRDIALSVVGERRDPEGTKVSEIMTRDVVSCRLEDDVEKALEAMERHQVRRVLVVDDAGALCGIISQGDVATRAAALERTGEVVREISLPGGA